MLPMEKHIQLFYDHDNSMYFHVRPKNMKLAFAQKEENTTIEGHLNFKCLNSMPWKIKLYFKLRGDFLWHQGKNEQIIISLQDTLIEIDPTKYLRNQGSIYMNSKCSDENC